MKKLLGGMAGVAEGILRTRGKKIDEEVDKAEGKKKEPLKEKRPPQSKKWTEK
jgi:F0F1-type ATP synthase membrane subunit b/b'